MKKCEAFTLAEVTMAKRMSGKECTTHSFSRVSKPKEPTNKMKNLAAFTLAEVLITLAIIGVVAALTIPTVITNYQKKMYVTQLKKSYNNLTNAFRTIMANDGVTKLTDKTFKIAAVYGSGNISEEYNTKYKGLNGNDIGSFDTAIYLADGTFLFFSLHKTPDAANCGTKKCSSLKEFQKTKFWQEAGDEIALDVNGPKGPNIVGRDLFVFYLENDGTLYPWGGADYAVYSDSSCAYDNLESCSGYWKNESSDVACTKSSEGNGCTARIMEEGWEMKY